MISPMPVELRKEIYYGMFYIWYMHGVYNLVFTIDK